VFFCGELVICEMDQVLFIGDRGIREGGDGN
jgi:hypothetical protein